MNRPAGVLDPWGARCGSSGRGTRPTRHQPSIGANLRV